MLVLQHIQLKVMMCLLEIKRLVDKYKLSKEIKDIGFSGHHKGIALDVVAYGLIICERHFT